MRRAANCHKLDFHWCIVLSFYSIDASDKVLSAISSQPRENLIYINNIKMVTVW